MELKSKYGKWTILNNEIKIVKRNRLVLCRCECGREKYVYVDHLRRGTSTSCISCSQRVTPKAHTHLMSKTILYGRWLAMRRRCNNPNDKYYKRYGGRGISICKEWNRFENFHNWALSHGYSHGLQLNRIDNDSNYCPENCNFVTPKENSRNRSNSSYFSAYGEAKTVGAWADDNRSVVDEQVLRGRIKLGWPMEKALVTPLMVS